MIESVFRVKIGQNAVIVRRGHVLNVVVMPAESLTNIEVVPDGNGFVVWNARYHGCKDSLAE